MSRSGPHLVVVSASYSLRLFAFLLQRTAVILFVGVLVSMGCMNMGIRGFPVSFESNLLVSLSLSSGGAVLFNIFLVLLFGLQHSCMSREWYKQLMLRWIGPTWALFERSVFVLASVAILSVAVVSWQPISISVVDEYPTWFCWISVGALTLGLLLVFSAVLALPKADILGWSLASRFLKREKVEYPPHFEFETPFVYRLCRHPTYGGTLLLLWFSTPLDAPVLSLGRLLFAASMTLYILIGTYFEEQSLCSSFSEYKFYRSLVRSAYFPSIYSLFREIRGSKVVTREDLSPGASNRSRKSSKAE